MPELELDLVTARRELAGMRIGVVYGSSSHEDALYMDQVPQADWSLTHILEALTAQGLATAHLDPTRREFLADLERVDLVFVNAHGPYGEDGRLQGLLDYLGKPYSFSGVGASAVAMDKLLTKAVFRELGITTPKSSLLVPASADPREVVPGWPLMVKAVDGGSSLGLRKVATPDGLVSAVADLRNDGYDRIFLEEYIEGRPVTISVIVTATARLCLPPLEAVIPHGEFYDAETKLHGNSTESLSYRVPTDLATATISTMEDAALNFGAFVGCRGAYRLDFVVSDGQPYALEANTVPGLQPRSNLPFSADVAGISYSDILLLLCADALRSHRPRPWDNQQ